MKKMNSVVFSFVVGIFVLGPCLSFSQNDLFLAERKFELGFYNEVVQSLEHLSERGELPLAGYLLLGRSYLKINEPYRAELFLSLGNSRDRSFDFPDFDFYLGKAAMMQGDYENARNQFLQFADHDTHRGRHYAQNAQVALGILETEPMVRVFNMPWNTNGAESAIGMLGQNLQFISRSIEGEGDCGYWNCNPAGQLVATVNGDPFSVENHIKTDLDNEFSTFQLSWNADGSRAAIVMGKPNSTDYRITTNSNNLSIFLVDLDENGAWDRVVPFEFNGIGFSNMSPYLSDCGSELYYSSNRPGGFGGFDLYLSKWDGSQWSEPVNLGPEINTPGNEISPFITGDHLFFSSDWHPGLGGLDVFYTSLSDPTVIFNAGRSINSTRDDFNFMVDAKLRNGYLVSNRPGGRGLDDIYGFSAESSLFNLSNPSILAEKLSPKLDDVEEKGERMIVEFLSRSNAVFVANPLPLEEMDSAEELEQLDVFSVQIASYKNDFDEQHLVQKLGDIGEVYKVFYHTDIKVRVGSFFVREEAEIAAIKIRNRGFSDAFVIKEQIVVSSTPPGTARKEDRLVEQQTISTPARYLVRLGAFRNTSHIDGSWMDGDLLKEASGEFTVLMLGYFDTIEEAEEARKKVAGRGFKDAFLLIDRNGERTRYRP